MHKFCRFHELKQNPVCKIHNDLKMQQQLKEHRLAHEEHVWLKGDAAPRRPEEPENKHLLCSDSSAAANSVFTYFIKLSFPEHRFVSAIHFPAAVHHNFSTVGLIKDDLILSCKGRKPTLQRS